MERDDKDYAIEFGAYLATAAERLLNTLGAPGADSLDIAENATKLRSAIYEFRKRATRSNYRRETAAPIQPST